MQARVLSGRFVGFEKPNRPQAAEFSYSMSQDEVVQQLRETAGFKAFANMIEKMGVATRDVIDGVVRHVRSQRMTSGEPVTTDFLRHNVKEYFRPRVMERLLDPKLQDTASWSQLRELLDELPGSDRGVLAADWYHGRYASHGDSRITVGVERTSGQNAGHIETRAIGIVEGNTAIEVKDITSRIDEEQLGAYLDMTEKKLSVGMNGKDPPKIKKVKYVFTKPEGAIENLRLFANHLSIQERVGRLTVEVFDWQGNRHTVTTAAEALQLLNQLTASRSQQL